MDEWDELDEEVQVRLTTAALREAALKLASLAEGLSAAMEEAGVPDPDGHLALRLLAGELRNPTSLDWPTVGHG